MPADWSREEVEATVGSYFQMLDAELRREAYDKSSHRRLLAPLLSNRSEGSIEFKHQNISAVLIKLGFPWIEGYKPLWNYQRLLFDVVSDRLATARTLHSLAALDVEREIASPRVDDLLGILTAAPQPKDSKASSEVPPRYLARRVNYLERESRNRSLGLAGEILVVNFERARLIKARREALADKIEHVSETQGDGLGFDILSFETSGRERLIEVKTTKYGRETPFFVSRNELSLSTERPDAYHLYRVFSVRHAPRIFALKGAISSTCALDPSIYVATVT